MINRIPVVNKLFLGLLNIKAEHNDLNEKVKKNSRVYDIIKVVFTTASIFLFNYQSGKLKLNKKRKLQAYKGIE